MDNNNISAKILKQIDTVLSENKLNLADKDIVLQRCFTESWFSDTLAWLLNPKGSHGFGVKFANEFLKVIANERSTSKAKYKSKASLLSSGNDNGSSAYGFSLKNASSIREFYLSRSVEKRNSRSARYCDVVFLDLDVSDGLFLIVENKLFTTNHPNQLEEYYELVEDKFSRAKIREYVYLTLDGSNPFEHEDCDTEIHKYWVNLSWREDVMEVIDKCNKNKSHPEAEFILSLLKWLNDLHKNVSKNTVEELRQLILSAAAECMIEELNRLGTDKSGKWSFYTNSELKEIDSKDKEIKLKDKKRKNHDIRIYHTSSDKKPLYIELLSNFTITVQSRRKSEGLFEKIIVPFGVHTDQVFNLIDIASRDIYYNHFGDNVKNYLSDKRRLSETLSDKKKEHTAIFDYVYDHQHELKIILASSKHLQTAVTSELDSSSLGIE